MATASAPSRPDSPQYSARFDRSGYLIGIALGGFFDGIVLHQILQWHHLLSGVQTGTFQDLRAQVMADGMFHLLMYVLGAIGLWLLLKSRVELARSFASRRLGANLLIGFGLWHVLDTLLSHWLLGIHRIRMDAASPLAYDLAWLAVFGLVPLAIGILMRRGRAGGDGTLASSARATTYVALLTAATVAAGALALRPLGSAADDATVAVVLRPDASPQQLLASLSGTDTRIVWSDAAGAVWVLRLDAAVRPIALYRHGAMYVSGTLTPAGCAAWFRA
ncbi:MAG TPA: DUF2243 domain-containing protein [Burkholderiaceae bacterium]|nr:DUF2243 domain-containing protein [Burkholderiaceae bacterium]